MLLLPDLIPWASESRGYVYDWGIQGNELRLTTAMTNVGEGRLELRGGAIVGEQQEVFQRIYEDGDSFTDVLAGTFIYHDEHAHIHFEDFAEYRLREVLPDGSAGDIIASGDKVSFCLLDVDRYDSSGPSSPQFLTCGQIQGISVGWADVYDRGLPGQSIDITNVANGQYWLEVVVDPLNRIQESDETNNTTRILIDLQRPGGGGPISADAFESNNSFEDASILAPPEDHTYSGLTIHQSGDDDYFRVTASESGDLSFRLSFLNSSGDIDLAIYNSARVLLGRSQSVSNSELVTVDATAGEFFYVRVYGYSGAVNDNYTLFVDQPEHDHGGHHEPTPGDDNLHGTENADRINLLAGNDTYRSLGDNDIVDGGAGNDWIEGGDGNDVLSGGLGNDTVSYANASAGVTVNLGTTATQDTKGAGRDRISGFEILEGSTHGDTLTGSSRADIIRGFQGSDIIEGLAGADDLHGGEGTDTVSYARSTRAVRIDLSVTQQAQFFAGTVLNGDAAGDRLTSFENIRGSSYADVLTGNSDDNTIEGAAGADIMTGGGGSNTVSYAASTAGVTIDLDRTTAQLGGGHGKGDVLSGFSNILGSAFGDVLSGTAGVNSIFGGAGNDTIIGRGGSDRLDGGANGAAGDTVSYAGLAFGVTIDLNAQSGQTQSNGDTLSGFENVTGTDHADTLTGNGANNVLNGGLGDDTIEGGGGNDRLIGGGTTLAPGSDTLTYATALGGVKVSLALTTAQATGGAGTDTISGFENLTGSQHNDTLTGDKLANTILGLGGDDLIQAGVGADVMDGGFHGALGDTVSYAASALGVTVDLGLALQAATNGTAINGDAAGDQLFDIENIIGSAKADTLQGDGGDNIIEGGLGNDVLTGNGGSDTISFASATSAVTFSLALQGTAQKTGGAGTDTATGFTHILGGKAADRLTGDGADNIITGGLGADRLDGGAGADTFVFRALTERGDTITKFDLGADQIEIWSAGFSSGLAAGALTDGVNFFAGNGALPIPTGTGPAFVYDRDDGRLYFDANGSTKGGATLLLTLTQREALTADDIIVV